MCARSTGAGTAQHRASQHSAGRHSVAQPHARAVTSAVSTSGSTPRRTSGFTNAAPAMGEGSSQGEHGRAGVFGDFGPHPRGVDARQPGPSTHPHIRRAVRMPHEVRLPRCEGSEPARVRGPPSIALRCRGLWSEARPRRGPPTCPPLRENAPTPPIGGALGGLAQYYSKAGGPGSAAILLPARLLARPSLSLACGAGSQPPATGKLCGSPTAPTPGFSLRAGLASLAA